MYFSFDTLNDDSRIWIFQSTNFLEFEKVERISARLMNFLNDWQAHGKDLMASFTIIHDRFIVVALDEASYQATGCSIDKLTHFVQALENELAISLLDRTQIAFRDENQMIEIIHMMDFRAALEAGEIDKDTIVFNNLIENKGQLKRQWETVLVNSWHKQWLPIA
ncbi:MAG: ABC transporter ATPase [Bacteroidetes bacterium]|nr:MAG: ABC transporter ATPase [Bacteroidota bacterium]